MEDSTQQFWYIGRGPSMSRIQTPIWSQTCSMGFISGLQARQSMTFTPWCDRKTGMSCAEWGVALFWMYTKFRPKTAVAQGGILSRKSLMLHWQLRVPSVTTTSSTSFLLSLWWLAPNTMTEGLWLLSVGLMHASVSLFPCLRLTQARPSLWNSMKRDLPLKTHCEDIVPPVTEVPYSARFPSHTAASPVIKSQSETPGGSHSPIASSQKPVYNAPDWQLPQNAKIISLRSWGAEIKRLSRTIPTNCLSSQVVVRLLRPLHLCWWGQSIHRFHRKI